MQLQVGENISVLGKTGGGNGLGTRLEHRKPRLSSASFPGSHAREREIEVVQAWIAWYFCHVKSAKDRVRVVSCPPRARLPARNRVGSGDETRVRGRRHLNCAWAYETLKRKRNEGSGQPTTLI